MECLENLIWNRATKEELFKLTIKAPDEQIYRKVLKNFDNIAKDYVYLLNKNNKVNTIVTLIITIVYFGLLQYLAKGQTVGKRLLKIRVVSEKQVLIQQALRGQAVFISIIGEH